MALRLKVTPEEFSFATQDGWVDGIIKGRRGLWVYVELGTDEEYIPKVNDDPKTEYRFFRCCNIYYAKTQEQLEIEDFEANEYNVTVIIYC